MNTEVYKQIFELKTENQNKTNEINKIKSINKKLMNVLTILNNKYNQLKLKFESYQENEKERIEKAVKEAEIKKNIKK